MKYDLNKILNEFTSGFKEEAYKKLKKIVKKNQYNEIINYNLAIMQRDLNYIDESINSFESIILKNNRHLNSLINLYSIHFNRGDYMVAIKFIDKALELENNNAIFLRDKSFCLHSLKKSDEALSLAIQSYSFNNKDIITINNLALIKIALQKYEEAKEFLLKGLEIDPKSLFLINTLGRCYGFLHQTKNAINCFEKAIKIQPNVVQPINNLAGFYLDNGEYKKALELYQKALIFDPDNITILANISKTYSSLNNDNLTLEYCQRCLRIDLNNNMVQKTYALALLKAQQYEKGWQYFDGRLNLEDFYEKNSFFFKIKKFLSNPKTLNINDKILIIREQGVGDEILYGTMYEDLLSKHQNVIIESDKRLIPLLNNSFNLKNNQQFVPLGSFSNEEEKLRNFDIVLFAGSLGKFFRNSSKNFKKEPYLKILNTDNTKINILLKGLESSKKIGISWKSFQKNYGDAKSISLETFKPLIEKDNLYFINLQYGDTEKEISNFMTNYSLSIKTFEEIDLFQDICSIAALLKNLDLFITVSNSTAHLAGALGVNTLLIKPKNHATFHYWNQPGSTTPWYKNITIIDQNNEKFLIKTLNYYINKIKII